MHPRSSSLLFLFLLVGVVLAQTTVPSPAQLSTEQPAQSSLKAITAFNQNAAPRSAVEHPLQSQVLKKEWTSLKDELIELKAQQRHSEAAAVFERMSRLERDMGWRKETDTRDPNSLDQGGETCADATVISSLPYCEYGNTTGFDNDYSGTCMYSNAPDVVYSFTPAGTVTVTISLCGSGYDTGLHVWRGCPSSGGVEVACNDDAVGGACGTQSCVTVQLHGENTYYIIVDGYSTASGAYLLNITTDGICHSEGCLPCLHPHDPVADNCLNAITVSQVSNTWGSTVGQTSDVGVPWCMYSVDSSPGVWFKVTGEGWNLVAWTCDNCTNFDTKLHVYTGTCSGLACVAANDDNPGCSVSGLFSEVAWCAENGVDYYILVSGFNAAQGDFTLSLGYSTLCGGCIYDLSLQPGYTIVDGTCAEENNCDFRPSEDLIVVLMVPEDGYYTVDLCQTEVEWDTYLYLSTECCGGTVIASNDDGCGNSMSKIACVWLEAGSAWLTIEGYDYDDCGTIFVHYDECVTQGACCYGSSNNPYCAFVTEADCDLLGGDWQEDESCSPGFCYAEATCPPHSEVSQIPALPDSPEASSITSDDARDQRVFEYITGLSGEIIELRFWGFLGDRGYYTPCVTDPLPVRITFRIDSLGYPGYCIRTIDTVLTGTPGYIYHFPFGDFPLMEYTVQLLPPVVYTSCWIGVMTSALSPCEFLWATSEIGDNLIASCVDGEWLHPNFDVALCAVPCLIDAERTAPFAYTGNTCGALKDCPLSTGEDVTIAVDFPYYSWWDISLCGSSPWDSKMRYTGRGCCRLEYVEDDNSCEDGLHPFITNYFQHDDNITITVNGATEFDCGEFTLLVTEALGRCCYFGPGEPWCGNMTYESCLSVSGNKAFTPYLDCNADPCPPSPECLSGSAVSQPPIYWGLNEEVSDIQTNYRAYEYYDGLTAPLDSIRFWGYFSPRDGVSYGSCSALTPQSFLITFHEDSLGWPGPLTDSYSMWLIGTPTFQFNVNPDRFIYEFTTAIADPSMSSGWISIATNGFDPEDDCILEWLTSPSGDDFHVYTVPAGGFIQSPYDLALCLKTEFTALPADSLTAYYNPVEGCIELRWYAPQSGWWTAYKSTDVNAVYPNGYTYIATSLFGPGQAIAFDSDLSSEQARYVVVMHDSHPTP